MALEAGLASAVSQDEPHSAIHTEFQNSSSQGNTSGGGGSSSSSALTEFTKRRNWSQRIIEELQDFLHILTPNGKIRYASPTCKSMTGYSPDELVGRMITDFIHADDSHL